MKALKVTTAIVFLAVGFCVIIGASISNQCTQLNALLGNCPDPSGWFIASGVLGSVGVVLLLALISSDYWRQY